MGSRQPERTLSDFAQNVGRNESVDNEVFAFNPKIQMREHDIIVIGSSAGGIKALTTSHYVFAAM
jgi:chemotaxis response regulator CheB